MSPLLPLRGPILQFIVRVGYYGDYVNVYLFSYSNLSIWFQESLCGRWLLQAFTTVFDVE